MGFAVAGVIAAGAIAGSMKSGSSTTGSESSSSSVGLRNIEDLNAGRSGLEATTADASQKQFSDLLQMISQGPGSSEVGANTGFQNQYANQLQQLMSNIANPNQQQNFNTAKQYFAPQQTALNQQFQQQGIQSDRLAARLGRAGNDPILRNKLAQEQTRQQGMLTSEIGAFGQQLPAFQADQIMGVGNQLSNLRQGLATQAMNNRSTLLSMGNQLATSERQYRLQTANRTGTGSSTQETSEGGGMKGAIEGGLAGFGAAGGMMSIQGRSSGPSTGGTQSGAGRLGSNMSQY